MRDVDKCGASEIKMSTKISHKAKSNKLKPEFRM